MYKKWWFIVIAVLVVGGIIGGVAGLGDPEAGNEAAAPTSTTAPAPTTEAAGPPSTAQVTTTEAAPTTAAPTGLPQVGQTVSFTNSEGSGTVTLNAVRRLTEAETTFGGTPTNGTYLVVDVTVTVSEGSASANPFLWRAQSPDGLTYDVDFLAVEGLIDGGEIAAGRQLRGNVAFDAPPGPLTVELTTFFADPLAIFQITE